MLFRAIALSVALLVSIGTIIPFMTDYTEAGAKHHLKHKKKKLKKYSKAWWRWYHNKQRHRRAIAARKRALRARQMMLAKQKEGDNSSEQTAVKTDAKQNKSRGKAVVQEDMSPAILPSGETAPQTWKRTQSSSSEQQFRVSDDTGNQLGTASLSFVGPAAGGDSSAGSSSKTLGGVSTSALRRTVIDKMVKEEGWVVNDYQKEVNGKKVYVVVAQSSVRGAIQSRLFYFTEVDGRIYSLATNSSNDSAEKIARESEKVINSLQKRPVQAELR